MFTFQLPSFYIHFFFDDKCQKSKLNSPTTAFHSSLMLVEVNSLKSIVIGAKGTETQKL